MTIHTKSKTRWQFYIGRILTRLELLDLDGQSAASDNLDLNQSKTFTYCPMCLFLSNATETVQDGLNSIRCSRTPTSFTHTSLSKFYFASGGNFPCIRKWLVRYRNTLPVHRHNPISKTSCSSFLFNPPSPSACRCLFLLNYLFIYIRFEFKKKCTPMTFSYFLCF